MVGSQMFVQYIHTCAILLILIESVHREFQFDIFKIVEVVYGMTDRQKRKIINCYIDYKAKQYFSRGYLKIQTMYITFVTFISDLLE